MYMASLFVFFVFFNDTATTEIYTLSLHDALPIFDHHRDRVDRRKQRREHRAAHDREAPVVAQLLRRGDAQPREPQDRKSTRLNSSHANISYAVFCLKKKKTPTRNTLPYRTTVFTR